MRVVTKLENPYIKTDSGGYKSKISQIPALMIHTARYNPVLQNTMFKGCNLKYLRQRLTSCAASAVAECLRADPNLLLNLPTCELYSFPFSFVCVSCFMLENSYFNPQPVGQGWQSCRADKMSM